jgi:hypothetical protein
MKLVSKHLLFSSTRLQIILRIINFIDKQIWNYYDECNNINVLKNPYKWYKPNLDGIGSNPT